MKMKNSGFIRIAGIIAALAAFLLLSTACAAQQQEIKEDDAFNAILAAEGDIDDMVISGFNVSQTNDLLLEAKNAFAGENYSMLLMEAEKINDTRKREQAKLLIDAAKGAMIGKKGDYPVVLQKTEEIGRLKARAYEVYDLITALEMRISELESIIDLGDAGQKLNESKIQFYAEAYDDAELLANEGFAIADKKAAEATELSLLYRSGKENIEYFVRNNWKNLIVGLFFAIVLGVVLYFQLSAIMRRRRLEHLRIERQVLLDLMKKAQYERFNQGLITNKEYEIKTSKFKERLMEVEKEIPVMESRMKLRQKPLPGSASGAAGKSEGALKRV